MAGSKSDYLENKVLDHILGNVAYSAPATVYIALTTTASSDAALGTEVSGGNYARASVTNNATNWPAASGGQKSNASTITFAQASASWGVVTGWAIMDAPTGGNMLWHGTLSANKTVDPLDTVTIGAGVIVITED